MKRRFWIVFSLLPTFLATTAAQAEVIDRIVAVVEDDAIFQSDVDQLIKQFLMMRGMTEVPDSDKAVLEQQALDELINSRLIVAKANKLNVNVSFADVEQRVNAAIDENKKRLGGDEAFQQALDAENMTLDVLRQTYREQIRNQMLVERVQQMELDRSKLQVSDEDLRALYEQRKGTFPMRPDVVHLKTIVIELQSSENARKAALEKIQELRDRIAAGASFEEIAEEYSEDPSAKHGGALGSVRLSDLSDRNFADAAAALKVGEVSEPVLTSFGYHLIKVNGADEATGTVELSHILVRMQPGDDDVQEVFARANKIHDEIMAGAPFDSMAAEYSDDEATAASGGDLEWLRVDNLPEYFRDVLSTMNVGDISPVLREPNGFRIVQLVEREEERRYTFDEVKDELMNLAREEKLRGAIDTYVEGLRDEFYVEVRDQ